MESKTEPDMIILADHDIEGQASIIWGILNKDGWTALIPVQLVMFRNVGLPEASSDRQVWRFAQHNKMILLTGNRRMKEDDSLEKTIRDENTLTSLPVLTIGNVKRMGEKMYREQCAARLLEIVIDLNKHMGAGRIFIP